ncbi:uncharacterized protein EV154DRAFT_510378, partial [Mucor mucedo]|uniref:uncharacterized protein n=1 Tax=Mucor mucedo TaxID=29922 RepID=UPI002220764B
MKRTQWGSSRGMSYFLIINACLCTSFTLLCAITSNNFRFLLKSSRFLLHFFSKSSWYFLFLLCLLLLTGVLGPGSSAYS